MKWMPLLSVGLFLGCQRCVYWQFGGLYLKWFLDLWILFFLKWNVFRNSCEFSAFLLQEEREKLANSETFAIRISNICNMVLFIAKVYASFQSGSLAIIASTLDSLLDLLSGFILWFTAFSMSTPNPYQYPIGKKRMQPLVSASSLSAW